MKRSHAVNKKRKRVGGKKFPLGTGFGDLFVDVDGIASPLVVVGADVGGGDRLVVLWADDDDDQVLFLRGRTTPVSLRC